MNEAPPRRVDAVPRDGKEYRVFIHPQSVIVAWEAGPNVWNNRTPVDEPGWDADATWYEANSHSWLPATSGEGEADVE